MLTVASTTESKSILSIFRFRREVVPPPSEALLDALGRLAGILENGESYTLSSALDSLAEFQAGLRASITSLASPEVVKYAAAMLRGYTHAAIACSRYFHPSGDSVPGGECDHADVHAYLRLCLDGAFDLVSALQEAVDDITSEEKYFELTLGSTFFPNTVSFNPLLLHAQALQRHLGQVGAKIGVKRTRRSSHLDPLEALTPDELVDESRRMSTLLERLAARIEQLYDLPTSDGERDETRPSRAKLEIDLVRYNLDISLMVYNIRRGVLVNEDGIPWTHAAQTLVVDVVQYTNALLEQQHRLNKCVLSFALLPLKEEEWMWEAGEDESSQREDEIEEDSEDDDDEDDCSMPDEEDNLKIDCLLTSIFQLVERNHELEAVQFSDEDTSEQPRTRASKTCTILVAGILGRLWKRYSDEAQQRAEEAYRSGRAGTCDSVNTVTSRAGRKRRMIESVDNQRLGRLEEKSLRDATLDLEVKYGVPRDIVERAQRKERERAERERVGRNAAKRVRLPSD